MPPELVADDDYWRDDSQTVSCTAPHTTETVFVYPLARPTPDAALEVSERCHAYVRGYVGISDASWIPWSVVLFLPSEKQVDDGASWVRCDLFFPATTGKSAPRETSFSGRDAARRPPAGSWACLDHAPDPRRRQAYVSCTEPHLFEATGDVIHTAPTSTYPTRRERARAATQCDGRIPRGDGLVPSVLWGSVVEGSDLSGACLFHRADGRPLPPRSQP